MKINSTKPKANSRLKLLGLVLYGLASSGNAQAAQVVQAVQGDLVLAFRSTVTLHDKN